MMDILEAGKAATLVGTQQMSFVILIAHAVNLGSVRHLYEIQVSICMQCAPSVDNTLCFALLPFQQVPRLELVTPCMGNAYIPSLSLRSDYMRAIRYLYCSKKLRNFKKLDLGTLLCMAFADREGEGIPEAALRYQALRLICDALQLPSSYSLSLIGNSFDSEVLTQLIWSDIGNDTQNHCGNSINCIVSNKENGNIKYKQYGTSTISIGGITLPTSRTESSWSSSDFVQTPTSLRNLRHLAQGISIQIPLIVEGESGCGKSFLIKELASLMGKRDTLLELHLDDQTDSKALIGSYVCSDVPGEFIWQPGLVTQAATRGTWLLIEDIDKASLEVIATLTPILESGMIPNGVGDDVIVHPAFRIFGTRTVSADVSTVNIGAQTPKQLPNFRHFSFSWHVVTFEMNSTEEVESILNIKYPRMMQSLRSNLLTTYSCLRKLVNRDGPAGKIMGLKPFSLRDLLKTAERFSRNCILSEKPGKGVTSHSGYVTEQQRVDCVADIVDVFLGSIRKKNESYRHIILEIGGGTEETEGWGLSEEVLDAHIFQRSPEVSVSADIARIGRAEFNVAELANSMHDDSKTFQQQFAFTKHALRLLETIAVCVSLNEPTLLVGETGTGKTTSVQELATMLKQTLVVQNISLSTDSSDLLGGFRPVSLRQLFQPTYEQFVSLFRATFSQTQNTEYLYVVAQYFRKEQWKKMLKAFQKAGSNAMKKVKNSKTHSTIIIDDQDVAPGAAWANFLDIVQRLVCNLPKITHGFAFAFVNGLLVEAMRMGHWVLLDEINLASPETLQGLVGILDGQSLCLTEKGDIKPIFRHPNFRIFAAMNPPTDVGKRELPETLRGRFTEIYVEEMEDKQDLQVVVQRYLQHLSDGVSSVSAVSDIVDIYLGCRATAEESLVDGGGQKPHYSLRSLTRSLKACNSFMELGFRPLSRSLYEGFLLSFQTQLDPSSRLFMSSFLQQCLNIKGGKTMILPPPRPGGRKSSGEEWVLLKPYWLKRGPIAAVDWSVPDSQGITKFVMTETVEKNIRDLARAVSANITAVLLQGPTSVGKTSMIEFLAAKCGYRCIRINNHEHTDVQEYVGGYITGSDGRLVFKDGVLVEALRRGDWIILDELNLAPSDVLEALNRLLDDNKELFIPETGEFVKPAPGFFLFATQNPAGAYGGRKPLSRAFRNRFIEISICDLPFPEVEHIVSLSCGIPPKYSKFLVSVMKEMQMRRQQSSILQGKYGSITTRDLIKWGKRKPQNPVDIVREGFMILAEKHRGNQEKDEILDVLLKACKVSSFDTSTIYEFADGDIAASNPTFKALEALRKFQAKMRDNSVNVDGVGGIAITYSVRRLWTLVSRCMDNSEPVLLIGETGTGKTTVCQLVAAERNQRIRIVNCHQSTETADIIGGLRPVRGRAGLLSMLHENVKKILTIDGHSLPLLEELVTVLNESENKGDESSVLTVDESRLSSAMGELAVRLTAYVSPDGSPDCEAVPPPDNKKLKTTREDYNNISNEIHSSEISQLIKATLELWRRYMSLFEWQDGPLVEAMKCGDVFILDEINLAEDAVIERLNSVLENSRTLTLAERGSQGEECGDESNVVVVAHPNFRFLATMNPGDDYGKRELSPALRSRFSEMWVPNVTDSGDIVLIISEMINISVPDVNIIAIANMMVEFMSWMNETSASKTMVSIKMSIREVLAWARFIGNWNCSTFLDAHIAFAHGAQMLVLDGLGIGTSISQEQITDLKNLGVKKLVALCPYELREQVYRTIIPASHLTVQLSEMPKINIDSEKISVGFFNIPLGSGTPVIPSSGYILNANSAVINFQRVLRAMKLPRPILLEGPPGVGKTSLISNLATLTGHKLVRINLSEHSELSDLIGTDLPTTSGSSESSTSKFTWCDGVFLTALKNGDWILLDELNLAPQSVLEGLNACFDHRGEVFIPEIGKSFYCPPTFRVFCAQNPMSEGGGRKGLPQSFLTRFSRVFVEAMEGEDMVQICLQAYENKLPLECLQHIRPMVEFVQILQYEISCNKSFARNGSPWEFNLRDIFRWCDLLASRLTSCQVLESVPLTTSYLLADAAHILFVSRLRTDEDRRKVGDIFFKVFGYSLDVDLKPQTIVSKFANDHKVMIGCEVLPMSTYLKIGIRSGDPYLSAHPLEHPLGGTLGKILESAATCVGRQWPLLLVGATSSGKRHVIRHLAYVTGNLTNLVEFSATPTTDATELLGSFEQASIYRHLNKGVLLLNRLCSSLLHTSIVLNGHSGDTIYKTIIQALSLYNDASEEIEIITVNNSLMMHSDKQIELNSGTSIFMKLDLLLDQLKAALAVCYAVQQENINLPLLVEDEALACLRESDAIFQTCKNSCNKNETSGNFEWVDGTVVKALEQGSWLLIDNVNLCSSSVLDRLNSLLEPNGYLLLTESGSGRVVRPHKNFRIFFTMDTTYGEISRAMRNRCVEIAVIGSHTDNLVSRTAVNTFQQGGSGDVAFQAIQASSSAVLPESVWNRLTTVYRLLAVHQQCPAHRLFQRFLQVFDLERSTGEYISTDAALHVAIGSVIPFVFDNYCQQAEVGITKLDESSSRSSAVHLALQALQKMSPYLSPHTFSVLFLMWIVESRDELCFAQTSDWLAYMVAGGHPALSFVSNEVEKVLSRGKIAITSESLIGNPIDVISQGIIPSEALRPCIFARLRRCHASMTSPVEKKLVEVFCQQHADLLNSAGLFANPELLTNRLFSPVNSATNDVLFDCMERFGYQRFVSPFLFELFQRGYERLQSRVGVYGLLSQFFGCTQGVVVTMRLYEAFTALEEHIFGERYPILWSEAEATDKAKSRIFSEAVSSYSDFHSDDRSLSLYSIAVIAASNDELNDCREGNVLSSIHTLLGVFQSACTLFYINLLPLAANNGSQAISLLLEAFGDVLRSRDQLSLVLLSAAPNISGMPWGHFEVCLRWLRKKCMTFSDIVQATCTTVSLLKDLEALCVMMNNALEDTFLSICAYWKTSFQFKKIRLWKEGGHAALPVKEIDWRTRKMIWNSLTVAAGIVKLPGFVDVSLARMDSSFSTQHMDMERMANIGSENLFSTDLSTMSHKIRRNASIMKEWLCLYSTFYWSCSNEISEEFLKEKKHARSLDFQGLTTSLSLQFANALNRIPNEKKIRTGLATTEGGMMEGSSSWGEVIDDEMKSAGWLFSVIAAEPIAARLLSEISNAVGKLCLSLFQKAIVADRSANSDAFPRLPLTNESLRLLKLLRENTASFLVLTLQSTILDVSLLRELQTLEWFLEAVLMTDNGEYKDILTLSNTEQSIFHKLLTNFSVILDVRLNSVVTSNLSNSLKSVQFRWGSELLTRLVGRSDVYGLSDDVEDNDTDDNAQVIAQLHPSEVTNTGAVRFFNQSITLELALRMLDATGLSLPLANHPDLRAFLMHDVPALTLSSCRETRTKLHELFRLTVRNGTCTRSQTSSPSRLDLLKYFALSAVFSCRDYFDSDAFGSIVNVVESCQLNTDISLFATLADLKLDSSCKKNAFLSGLFSKCLNPLLEIILWADKQTDTASSTWVTELGRAWVYLGILRMNLLIPHSPVDPSVKPSIKVDLLSKQNGSVEQEYAARDLELSMTGASRISAQMLALARYHVDNATKIQGLTKKIIYRPDEIPLFTDLYEELREANDSLLNSDRVLEMLSLTATLASKMSEVNWSKNADVSRAKEYMTELSALSREELSWQESLSGFLGRISNVYGEYEDVLSPIVSAIGNISQGMRTVMSCSVSWSEECCLMQSREGSGGVGRCAAHILKVPSLSHLRLNVESDNAVEEFVHEISSTVERLEKYSQPLIERGCSKLISAQEADNSIPFNSHISTHTSTCIRFLALSRIEYLLGCQVAEPTSLDAVCAEHINHFVETYISNSEARKIRAMRKLSLYQYKEEKSEQSSSEATFTSNDELEELADLQMHFPDHLGTFADIVLKGDQDLNEKPVHKMDDTPPTNSTTNASTMNEDIETEGKLIEEDGTISTLISFHMRKVFVHCYLERQHSGANWIKNTQIIHSGQSSLKSIFNDLRTSLQMSMFENLLMSGKMLQWGVGHVNDKVMETETRGFSLLVLHALSAECSRGVGENLSKASNIIEQSKLSYGWVDKLASVFESVQRPVDRDLLLLLESKCISSWNPLNFQIDANPVEITKASSPLRKILQSTMNILAMFPGNEILVVICQICARILQFPITVPIGKMLASVEFLLVRMQEWEQYAARHVSMKDDMQALVSLISDWRKLELKSWADLLRCKEVIYASRAKKMWFTLSSLLKTYPDNLDVSKVKYDSDSMGCTTHKWDSLDRSSSKWLYAGYKVPSEALDAGLDGHYNVRTLNTPAQQSKAKSAAEKNEYNESNYLQQVFEALDGFLRSSVVGEFPTRLHMVRLFALDLSQAAKASVKLSDKNVVASTLLEDYKLNLKRKMSFISYGVWQYYEQFLGSARQFQNRLKSPIQQRLKDEIKISRWDQLNTYAVIEHSAKVHRKLNKIIREYAIDVLDYPVSAIFQKEIMGNLVGEQGDLSGAVAIPSSVSIFPALNTYHLTLSKQMPISIDPASDRCEEGSDDESVVDEGGDKKVEEVAVVLPPPPVYFEAEDIFGKVFSRHVQMLPFDLMDKLRESGVFQVPESSSRLLQSYKLQQKIVKTMKSVLQLKEDIKEGVPSDGIDQERARFGYQAADIAEALCTDIFYRVDVLRSKEAGKSAPKNVKHRAMTEFLKRLKGEGISHLKSVVPGEIRRPVEIFALSPLLHEEFACDLGHSFDAHSSVSPLGGSVLEQAEGYYIRNVSEVNQLRVQVTAPISGDITSREASVMLGQAENMFYSLLRTRTAVSATISDFYKLCSVVEKLKQLVNSTEINKEDTSSPTHMSLQNCIKYVPDQKVISEMFTYRRSAGSAVLCSLREVKHLLAAAADSNVPRRDADDSSDCVACVSSWKIDASFNALNEIVAAVESCISVGNSDSPSQTTSKIFSEGLGLDMANSSFSSCNVYNMDDVEYLKSSTSTLLTHHGSFIGVSQHLDELLSVDVTSSMHDQLMAFVTELTVQMSKLSSIDAELTGKSDIDLKVMNPASELLSETVDKCLLAVQNLKNLKSSKFLHNFNGNFGETVEVSKQNESGIIEEGDSSDEPHHEKSLIACLSLSYYSFSVLKLPGISNSLEQLLDLLTSHPIGSSDYFVLRTITLSSLPIFDCIVAAVVVLIEDMLSSYKSFGKLLYVSTRMFRVLLSKGFCSDESKDGDGEGGGDGDVSKMTFEDDVEGTGMGEGEGHKDVSDQIENEEQLLGLKGDQKEEQKSDRQLNEEEKEQGVDMMQDFDGDMCDLPDNDNKEEEDEKEDAEREMGGELDLDNIVDEKEWGDDEDAGSDTEEQQDDKETFEDSKGEGETIDGEMVTNKDDENDDGNQDEKGGKSEKEDQKEQSNKDDDNGGEDVHEEEDMLEKPLGVDVQKDETTDEKNDDDKDDTGEVEEGGQVMDEETNDPPNPEGEDLPDNMDLGGDDEGGGDNDDAMDMEDDNNDSSPDDDMKDKEGDDEIQEDDADDKEEEESMDQNAKMFGGEENLNNEELPDPLDEDASADDIVEDGKKEDTGGSSTPAFGVQSSSGQDAMMQQKEQESDEVDDDTGDGGKDGNIDEDDKAQNDNNSGSQSKSDDNTSGSEGKSSGDQSTSGNTNEGEQKNPQNKRNMEPPNPFRQQGDINEKWHRRLDVQTSDDQDKADDDNKKSMDNGSKASYEYDLKDEGGEEQEKSDMQVLAESTEQEAVQLPTPVETEEDCTNEDAMSVNSDDEGVDEDGALESLSKNTKKRSREPLRNETVADSDDDSESAKKRQCQDEEEYENDDVDNPEDEEMDSDSNARPSEEDISTDRGGENSAFNTRGGLMVRNVDDWLSKGDESNDDKIKSGYKDEDEDDDTYSTQGSDEIVMPSHDDLIKAREQWSLLTATHKSDCIRLCEQLRLVLEPTLASRLQGDYRTGKRINMRRVISYVASGFRKDKIWMRRTKPSKRDYQVMMMIDDSSSMGQAGPLAMSALNVISGALSRLEVGSIGVCAFSERLTPMHAFSSPFTDEAGASLYSRFKFQASQTRLANALQSVVPMFEDARRLASTSSNVVLQICFVVSDARIDSDNRERLNKVVRELAEKNILAVLIIIDKNDDHNDSIFATKSVEFTSTGLVTKGYLDDFPFPYYVAIQQVEALPEVLSDVLKQWFELVQSQLSC